MIIPAGDYRYEIRRARDLVAIEQMRVGAGMISGAWTGADGRSRLEIEAVIGVDDAIVRVALRYSSSLFKRSAAYEACDESFRGSVSALAGRNEILIKLGRFREVDVTGITLFRALIVARVRSRGQPRWTGRVAIIDANTLVAASIKQTCRRTDQAGNLWIYETRMGDFEEIELDRTGRLLKRRDNRGVETVVADFTPAAIS
jgi:hypothetical protein